MQYKVLESLVSPARARRYLAAAGGDKRRAVKAYKTNMELSQSFMGLICMFEVILRNRIDAHYRAHFQGAGPEGWLWANAKPAGAFDVPGCKNTRTSILEVGKHQGANRSHDRIVAAMSFGFWKYLFANNQFRAGGNTLLRAFPSRPHRTNQSVIYAKIDRINAIRNRVAHHEPICFDRNGSFSSQYAVSHQRDIYDLVDWMGVPAAFVFRGIDRTYSHAVNLDRI